MSRIKNIGMRCAYVISVERLKARENESFTSRPAWLGKGMHLMLEQ